MFTAVSRGREGRDCLPSCLLDVYPTPMQVSRQLHTSSTGPCAGNVLGHSAPINRAIGIHAPSCQTTVRARQWMSLAMLAIDRVHTRCWWGCEMNAAQRFFHRLQTGPARSASPRARSSLRRASSAKGGTLRAAPFITAKEGRPPRWPSADEWTGVAPPNNGIVSGNKETGSRDLPLEKPVCRSEINS